MLLSDMTLLLAQRISAPSDGVRVEFGDLNSIYQPDGLVVVPYETNSPFRRNDIVIAVAGHSMLEWANLMGDTSVARPLWREGDTIEYIVRRGEAQVTLPITLGDFPIGAWFAEYWGNILPALLMFGIGAYVFARRPHERAAQLLFLTTTCLLTLVVIQWLSLSIQEFIEGLAYVIPRSLIILIYHCMWSTLLWFILIFPKPQPWLIRARWIVPLLYLLPLPIFIFYLGITFYLEPNRILWHGDWVTVSDRIALGYGIACVIALVLSYRNARRDPIARLQAHWAVSGFVLSLLLIVTLNMLPKNILGAPILARRELGFLLLPIPIGLGVAILRYRLFEIDRLINRALVYGALTACIAVGYLIIVGGFGAMFQTNEKFAPALFATIVMGILVLPLRSRLQGGVNRIVPLSASISTKDDSSKHVETSASPLTQRPRRWNFARVFWIFSFLIACGLVLASIPTYFFELGTVTSVERAAAEMIGSVALYSPSPIFEFWMDLSIATASLTASFLSLALAVLVFLRRGQDRVGFVVSLTLLIYGVVMTGPMEFLLLYLTGSSVLALDAQAFLWVPFMILFYIFPDGTFMPRSTRWLALALLPLGFGLMLITPQFYQANYNALLWLFLAGYVLFSFTGPVAQVYRYRRTADERQRRQIKWVGVGLLCYTLAGTLIPAMCVVLARQIALPRDANFLLLLLVFLARLAWWIGLIALPLTLAIAILRYRLWDIDVFVNRALVYGSLTVLVLAGYVVLVTTLGALFQTSGNLIVSLAATAAIAALFQPLRERLQRGVNRLMYGERDEPYSALSRLGQRLEATLAPDAILPAIAETVAQTLKLPYAAIALADYAAESAASLTPNTQEKFVASYSSAAWIPHASSLERFPLVYQHETIGALVVAPRDNDEGWNQADRQLLSDFARQASVAAYAVRVTMDLQRSRERLVTEREQERRRIRRDLHDGLGPALASITLKLDATRNLLPPNAGGSAQLLKELKAQTQGAIADIRRLVYDLRPPALDELGLVGALREYATRVRSDELEISVQVSEPLPPLSAALEVATYRIITEGLVNVQRHANAHHCFVAIGVNGDLELEIQDDGAGLPDTYHAGVGLTSMRERAAELGGTLVIENVPEGGTRVMARLPLAKDEGG